MSEMETFLRSAAHVVPSERQKTWFDTEFYGFVHFTVNTYTDREWGLGDESEAIFNPTELDADQWVAALKSAGMRGMVLTAKHHDGFCLWPSKYTEHSVKNSPYKNGKGDIVREAMEACRRGGIKFGFYLSPWDRNSKLYGTSAYNEYYRNQLTELLTQYGDIFMVWFDGACGEGPNGKKQDYDFESYFELVRKYQPNAVMFKDDGPDVRWCGNEAGHTRYAEWSVVPGELVKFCPAQTFGACLPGGIHGLTNTSEDVGSLSNILYSKGLAYCPAEVNMSIRPGWFYHQAEEPHSLERLFSTYLASVGGNASFHLNVPPMPNGRFDARDVQRLKELGELIRTSFANDLMPQTKLVMESISPTQCAAHVTFAQKTKVRFVELREDITEGQRVAHFVIEDPDIFNPGQRIVYEGTCIGHKKICVLEGEYSRLDVIITSARDTPQLLPIRIY